MTIADDFPRWNDKAMDTRVELEFVRSVINALDNNTPLEEDDLAHARRSLDFVLRQVIVEREVPRLQRRIIRWANSVFPHRTQKDVILKLFEEVGEVLKEPGNQHELADVLILVLDLAVMANVDIIKAAHEKMETNERRQWKINELGIMRHE